MKYNNKILKINNTMTYNENICAIEESTDDI